MKNLKVKNQKKLKKNNKFMFKYFKYKFIKGF
jgi:hypothetical protein